MQHYDDDLYNHLNARGRLQSQHFRF
jgi:hypothetical protein